MYSAPHAPAPPACNATEYAPDTARIPADYVPQRVRALTGHTPRRLRVTCFVAVSALYGPQYLIEAFGLSLTHASRYGNLKEYLLEEEVKQQKKGVAELSRRL